MSTVTELKTVTLTNSLHGTEVTVRVPKECLENGVGAWSWIQWQSLINASDSSHPAHRQRRRVEKTLCGMSDCKCGTVR